MEKAEKLPGQPEDFSDQSKPGRPGYEEEIEQPRTSDIQNHKLAEALRDIEKGYDPSSHFETQLMLEGLLSRLEQARILPVVENPNPHDPSQNMDEHDQWWEAHPEEAVQFDRQVDKRNEILKCLYIGALIGSRSWNIP